MASLQISKYYIQIPAPLIGRAQALMILAGASTCGHVINPSVSISHTSKSLHCAKLDL